MRRLATTVALSAIVGLALPVPSASACSPGVPPLTLDKTTVPQGGRLRVAGDGNDKPFECDMTPPTPTAEPSPTASPTAEPTPVPSEEPSEEPSESATPEPTATTTTAPVPLAMVPVAHQEALTAPRAIITIGKAKDGYYGELVPESVVTLGTAPYTKDAIGDGHFRYRLDARVKIPSDLAPGPYVVHAGIDGAFFFGAEGVTVTAALPDTGGDVAPAVRLAALLLLTGVGALVLDQWSRGYARISESASVRVD